MPSGYSNYSYQLQYAAQLEGRIRAVRANPQDNPTALVFDYMLKDHLGNVRMVLTDEVKVNTYPAATLESIGSPDPAVDFEKNYFDINAANVVDNSQTNGIPAYNNNNGFDYNHHALNSSQRMSTQSQKVYKLNSAVAKTGLGTTLKVMAGDKLDIFGLSYYNTSSGSGSNVPVNDLLSSFVGGAGSAVGGKISAAQAEAINPLGSAIYSFVQNRPEATSPRAYINYIFFDEQFTFVSGGYSRVGNSGDLKQHYTDLQQIPVPKNGYVYVYCSNETDANVFFDNLQVVHTPGPLLEETHYYPFGLTMAGISSKAAGKLENRRKFNDGTELENKEFSDGSGLELYSTEFRSYDAQIGRFHQIDPLGELFEYESLYVFGGNNPILFNDPLGLSKTKDSTKKAAPTPKPIPAPKPPPSSAGAHPLPQFPNPLLRPVNPGAPLGNPGKVIDLNPKIEVPPLPGINWLSLGLRALGTVGGVLIPTPTGEGASLPDHIRDKFFDRNMVTLYRGVHNNHPDIVNARNGMAVPWGLIGGHSNEELHNEGVLESVFTSWTINKNVAAQMAGRKGWGGIILTKRFHVSELIISPDKFFQGEFLIRGIVTGAIPQNARPYSKR